MNIDSIRNGIVIDHIAAGKGMQIYNLLKLDELDCSVAIIKNVSILHGKGNGILRQMIRQYLSKQSCVRQMQDASLETGGHGITRVELK